MIQTQLLDRKTPSLKPRLITEVPSEMGRPKKLEKKVEENPEAKNEPISSSTNPTNEHSTCLRNSRNEDTYSSRDPRRRESGTNITEVEIFESLSDGDKDLSRVIQIIGNGQTKEVGKESSG